MVWGLVVGGVKGLRAGVDISLIVVYGGWVCWVGGEGKGFALERGECG